MARWEFKLPDIGEGVVEGEIVKWLVQPGDQIVEDQPLLEVMTDKATVVIPSPRRGKVLETVGKEGAVAKVHSTLVVLEVEGGAAAEAQAAAPRPPTGQEAPSIPERAAGEPAPLSTAPGPAQGRAVQAQADAGEADPLDLLNARVELGLSELARLDGRLSGKDLLAQLRRTVLEAHTHQDCPFEKVVEWITIEQCAGADKNQAFVLIHKINIGV